MSAADHCYAHTAEEVLKGLDVDPEKGLTEIEISERHETYGENEFQKHHEVSLWDIFFRQFLSPFVYMLLAAAVVSFVLHHETDAYIILAAVGITVCFGFWQEAKAEKTLDALRKLIKKKATVIRRGHQHEIDAADVVPGDILVINEGDRISADARLLDTYNLEVNEAPLTGEAEPQAKHIGPLERGTQVSDQENMVFRGTVVTRGHGTAVVTATGSGTELGKIAETVQTIGRGKTPLQENIGKLAYTLTIVIGVVLTILVVFGLWRETSFVELLTTAIAVAVAAIPESLVAAVTVILAIGMTRLLKVKALVRRLVSAETLGGTTVACVDKTGTLTKGEMQVDHYALPADVALDDPFPRLVGMVANEAYLEERENSGHTDAPDVHGSPTDAALMNAGLNANLRERYETERERVVDEQPFSSEKKYMATLTETGGSKRRLWVKGAPDRLITSVGRLWQGYTKKGNLSTSALDEDEREALRETVEELSAEGFRLLGLGYRDVDGATESVGELGEDPLDGITFVGFVAIADPLRDAVPETTRLARDAGMRVVMITGDHRLTAETIAARAGIKVGGHNILSGEEMNSMTDEELRDVAPHINVYARIVPNDKLRIVKALQSHNEIVAMTGDGVNDAPALKQADVGVAMGSGTEVAKEASDLIILDDNFTSIIKAVKEGRVILDNIRKVSLYLLKDTFSEVILLGFAVVTGLPLPILAAQVLWINIVEDGLPAFALSYEPAERDVMKLKPEGRNRKLVTREMKIIIFAIGLITDTLLLGIFIWLAMYSGFDVDYVRTIVFAGLAFNSLLVIFSLKSLRHSILSIPIFNNWYLIGSVFFGILMLLVAIYVPPVSNLLHLAPLAPEHWLLVVTVSIVQLILIEIVKYFFTHHDARFRV